MAERRMFAKTVIDSDAFLDMPLSSQALYFHLAMRADDDGFVNNPKKVQRMIGGSDDDFRLLIAKRFILIFESGVIVIKHWKIHNYIQRDRYKPTVYQAEKAQLQIKGNGSYKELDTKCIQDVSSLETQVRLGKDSIGKDKDICVDKPHTPTSKFIPPTIDQVKDYCKERNNTVNAEKFHDFYTSKAWMVGKNKMKDWKAAVRNWERSEIPSRTQTSKAPNKGNFDQRKYDDNFFENIYTDV